MAWMDEVSEHLGAPARLHEVDGWEDLERMLGARVPADYKSFCDSYGACIIHDFLYVSHPGSNQLNTLKVFALNADFLHDLRDSNDPLDRITRPLMDEGPGGMLMWGHTDIGDKCFLQPTGEQAWAVCVWYREGEWHESDLSFSAWLQREARGIDGECNIFKYRDVPPRYLPLA